MVEEGDKKKNQYGCNAKKQQQYICNISERKHSSPSHIRKKTLLMECHVVVAVVVVLILFLLFSFFFFFVHLLPSLLKLLATHNTGNTLPLTFIPSSFYLSTNSNNKDTPLLIYPTHRSSSKTHVVNTCMPLANMEPIVDVDAIPSVVTTTPLKAHNPILGGTSASK